MWFANKCPRYTHKHTHTHVHQLIIQSKWQTFEAVKEEKKMCTALIFTIPMIEKETQLTSIWSKTILSVIFFDRFMLVVCLLCQQVFVPVEVFQWESRKSIYQAN
jgi:hypothetical protein